MNTRHVQVVFYLFRNFSSLLTLREVSTRSNSSSTHQLHTAAFSTTHNQVREVHPVVHLSDVKQSQQHPNKEADVWQEVSLDWWVWSEKIACHFLNQRLLSREAEPGRHRLAKCGSLISFLLWEEDRSSVNIQTQHRATSEQSVQTAHQRPGLDTKTTARPCLVDSKIRTDREYFTQVGLFVVKNIAEEEIDVKIISEEDILGSLLHLKTAPSLNRRLISSSSCTLSPRRYLQILFCCVCRLDWSMVWRVCFLVLSPLLNWL